MLRIERSESSTELDHHGTPYTLTVERIDILLGGRAIPARIGASYGRPKRIARNGKTAPIPDLVMIVRLIGLLAVVVAMFVREVRR